MTSIWVGHGPSGPRAAKRTFWGPGQGSEMRPCIGTTFVNLFCMDFNVELSLASYILSAMPVYIRPGFVTVVVVLVLGIGFFRSRVYSNSGFLKQGVWGHSPSEALGSLVTELPKM